MKSSSERGSPSDGLPQSDMQSLACWLVIGDIAAIWNRKMPIELIELRDIRRSEERTPGYPNSIQNRSETSLERSLKARSDPLGLPVESTVLL